MLLRKFLSIVCLLSISATAQTQEEIIGRVGINTDKPKATLDIRKVPLEEENGKIPAQGVIFPKMTTAERGNSPTTKIGAMIYNTSKKCVEMHQGGGHWYCLCLEPFKSIGSETTVDVHCLPNFNTTSNSAGNYGVYQGNLPSYTNNTGANIYFTDVVHKHEIPGSNGSSFITLEVPGGVLNIGEGNNIPFTLKLNLNKEYSQGDLLPFYLYFGHEETTVSYGQPLSLKNHIGFKINIVHQETCSFEITELQKEVDCLGKGYAHKNTYPLEFSYNNNSPEYTIDSVVKNYYYEPYGRVELKIPPTTIVKGSGTIPVVLKTDFTENYVYDSNTLSLDIPILDFVAPLKLTHFTDCPIASTAVIELPESIANGFTLSEAFTNIINHTNETVFTNGFEKEFPIGNEDGLKVMVLSHQAGNIEPGGSLTFNFKVVAPNDDTEVYSYKIPDFLYIKLDHLVFEIHIKKIQ